MHTYERKVIGGAKNFWLYSKSEGYDLTHPPTPSSEPVFPRIKLSTTSEPATIDPKKTALVVVDLQNYFLSPALGRPRDAVGMKVVDNLLKFAIPACRKLGIPVVWLSWGLTDQDIDEMPPTILRGFDTSNDLDKNFDGVKRIKDLGHDIGPVELDDGSKVEAGRTLIRDQWNSASYTPLAKMHEKRDIWINKNRLSGFWGGTEAEKLLNARGIRTLLFSGANTDQCVGGSIQDAFTKGWDCLLLNDGCATTSPKFAQQTIEFNTEAGWGFVLSCEELARAADGLQTEPVTKV